MSNADIKSPIGQLNTQTPNYILLKEYTRLDYLFESGCGYFNIYVLRKQKSQGYQKVGISKLFNIPGTKCLMSNSQQNVCSENNSNIQYPQVALHQHIAHHVLDRSIKIS
jgi:hypothetical protein